MLFSCSSLEIPDPTMEVLPCLENVRECGNTIRWDDWKRHESGEHLQDLGGFIGTLDLSGPGLMPLQWILKSGALMNVGKGAAFGNGCYKLDSI